MGELDGPQRVAIAMAFFDDLAHPDIAARLDAPLGTVKLDTPRPAAAQEVHGMNYSDPDLQDRLAADYVAGVLRGATPVRRPAARTPGCASGA